MGTRFPSLMSFRISVWQWVLPLHQSPIYFYPRCLSDNRMADCLQRAFRFHLLLLVKDVFIIFHHFFLLFPVFHALSHGEWHALACPLRFGCLYQRSVPRLNILSCQSSVVIRALIALWCWSECCRSCSSFWAQKRRMVYNLLFHAPLRCFIDIKLCCWLC